MNKNRILCFIICILLCISLLPVNVYATDDIENNQTVQATNDVKVDVQFNWKTESVKEKELPIKAKEIPTAQSLINDYLLKTCSEYYLANLTYEDVFTEVPLYLQTDYPDVAYGEYGTIASHGCGITCVSMVTSYFRDKEVAPDLLAYVFGSYNTEHGSLWVLFEDSAEILDIPLQERTYDWETVYEALKNGQVVISLQNSKGIFTKGGHFIVLTGIGENDNIYVNDPNGKNYEKEHLKDGFENGFTIEQIRQGENVYWIYEAKEFDEYNLMLKEFVEQFKK